jgi:hypothetical protein
MQIDIVPEPIVLTSDQITANTNRRAGGKNNNQAPAKKRTPTNLREVLWHADDPIIGLHQNMIESYAHAYQLNGQIRSAGSFEAFLRMRLMRMPSVENLSSQPTSSRQRDAAFRRIRRIHPPLSRISRAAANRIRGLRILCASAARGLGLMALDG